MVNRKHFFSIIILCLYFAISPIANIQAHNPLLEISPKAKIVGSSFLAIISGIATVHCYNKQRGYAKKIKTFELNELDEASIKNYIHQLRKLESSREFYKNFMAVLGVLTLASMGVAIWGGIELYTNKEDPNDLPLEQRVEVLPGEFVIAHADGTYTVDNQQKTFRISQGSHLLQTVSRAPKTWICYVEKILQAHSEVIDFDPSQAGTSNPAWESSLCKKTSKVLEKIKNEQPLNLKDDYLFRHFINLDFDLTLALELRSFFSQ